MFGLSDIWRRPPAERFAALIAFLREIIGIVGYRQVNPPLNIAVYKRLGYFLRRFNEILAQPARPAQPPRTPRPHCRAPRPQPNPSAVKLPTRFGWMHHLYPGHQIPGASSQLAHLLIEPDMIALLNDHPGLARLLRPLCHMLRIKPPPHLARTRQTARTHRTRCSSNRRRCKASTPCSVRRSSSRSR
jgi:hypothetical protein